MYYTPKGIFLELRTVNYVFCLKFHLLYTKPGNVMMPKHLTKLAEKTSNILTTQVLQLHIQMFYYVKVYVLFYFAG